ncbi:glutamate receptor ionotropic, kainate 5-like [Stegodyphus dumicola]|uniref:glutamate receptor ionotropic, kainate 5-like n=1 Tax=Stegodyphus dumicola TaxID=202533 RepID=UPI0015A7834C|nr:glutamate receptor ionotropic, kainate 5-like [Stegodyphus dumicola]
MLRRHCMYSLHVAYDIFCFFILGIMQHLKVVAVNTTPLFEMKKREDGTLEATGGADQLILKVLSDYLPFSYDLINREDYLWGNLDDTGNWTGMIGMMCRKEMDMALGWVATTYARHQVVDFSFPYLVDANIFVTASPQLLQKDFAFVDPFQTMVWALLLFSIPLSSITLTLLTEYGVLSNRKERNFWKTWLKETETLLIMFLSQGSYRLYRNRIVRFFLTIWSICKLILVFSYTSTLLSFLMVPAVERPLRTVQELRDAVVSGRYQFAVFKGTSHVETLMESRSGIIKDLADHIRQHPENMLNSHGESVYRMQREKLAVLNMRLHFLYSASAIGLDLFHMSSDNIGFNIVGVPFRKGFPYMERVNMIIHRMAAAGIYMKQINEINYYQKLKAPVPPTKNNKRPLSLQDIWTSVQILIVGHLVSLICLIAEIGYHKLRNRNPNI